MRRPSRPAAAVLFIGALLFAQAAPALALPAYKTEISARLGLEQQYTDNLQLMSITGGEDFISSVRPGFSAAATSPESGAKLDYDFGWSRYWKLDDEFLSHRGRGNVWQQWEHVRFDAAGSFSREEYPIELSPETGAITGLRDVVSPYYRAAATPGVAYQLGEERSLRAGYNYSSYWSNDPRFQNSAMHAPNVTLGYALDKFNVIDLGYTYERGLFSAGRVSNIPDFTTHRANGSYTRRYSPHLDLNAAYAFSDLDFQGGAGYRTHQATLGTNYGFSENLSISLNAGYYLIDQGGRQLDGPVLNGLITKTFPGGQVQVAGDYGFGEDYYSAENLGVYEYWGGRVSGSYQVAERLKADANGSWRRNEYALEGRTDEYWSAGAGLSWLLRPWLSARAAYSHTDFRSEAPTSFTGRIWNFRTNSVLVGLTATYK